MNEAKVKWFFARLLILAFFLFLFVPPFLGNQPKLLNERRPIDPETYKFLVRNALPSAVVEKGHSYISLEIEGRPGEYHKEILELIRDFEKKHGVKVTANPSFETSEPPFSRPQIHGMWLTHN